MSDRLGGRRNFPLDERRNGAQSTAEFDYTKETTIRGAAKEVHRTNPHSYIRLLVDDAAGTKMERSVEMGSPRFKVPEAKLSTAGAGLVGRGAAATAAGDIMSDGS